MRKVFLTQCIHPETDKRRMSYEELIKPRFLAYCKIHDFEFVEMNQSNSWPRDLSFSKFYWLKHNMAGLSYGDVVTYMDTDCLIMDGTREWWFDADFSIVQETCGLLCTGTWSIRISPWSQRLVMELCNEKWHDTHRKTKPYRVWRDNLIIYYALGLAFGQSVDEMGTADGSLFTSVELEQNVKILPAKWGCTFDPGDVDFSDKRAARTYKTYKHISKHVVPDRLCEFDDIIVRHLTAGSTLFPWAERYYKRKMKVYGTV